MEVRAWTDGACSPKSRIGGWGSVVEVPGLAAPIELSGWEADTTSNRMELTAVIRVLESVPYGSRVTITLDSQYVCYPFLKGWIGQWRKTDFTGRLNPDLWRLLHQLVARMESVKWIWIPGHRDNVRHNRADALAVAARTTAPRESPVNATT